VPLLKVQVSLDSLFHQRSCPVNLLFAVDDESAKWIKAYLDLRDFDDVRYSFRPCIVSDMAAEAAKKTGFRDNTALLKLETHTLFPGVDNIILIDFDVVFANDICEQAHAETMRMKMVPKRFT
jgi:lipopolysaccharide biosynthesis glycosyltransferase